MTETAHSPPATMEVEARPKEPDKFRLDVDIKGLPYVFEGTMPQQPSEFELVVSVPDWDAMKPAVDEEIASNSWYASQYRRLQQTLHLGDGMVGSVWVNEDHAKDGADSIYVSRIQTDNRYLPEDSPYHGAEGVGSFILDNLCAVADVRGWRIYLTPLERDGRLMGTNLNNWYNRRGFEFSERATRHMYRDGSEMMRLPGKPDMSQSIVEAFVNSE